MRVSMALFPLLLFQSLFAGGHAWLAAQHRHPPRQVLKQNPQWLDEAMGNDSNNPSLLSQVLPLAPGLSGFCVNPELGFVAIVSDATSERFGAVLVSPTDTQQVQSAEALTLVQLAGGLDLATPILSPDLLERLVREELAEEEEDEGTVPKSIGFCSLTQVTVQRIPESTELSSDPLSAPPPPIPESSPAREQAIQESLPKVQAAIQKLPGLSNVQSEQVLEQLIRLSNEQGNLDRNGFSSLLQALRTLPQQTRIPSSQFDLDIQLMSEDTVRRVVVTTTNAVWALGLVLRHRAPLIVTSGDDDGDAGSSDAPLLEWSSHQILEPFPNFRPLSELLRDAQEMDGFIQNMFHSYNNNVDDKTL